MVMAEKIVDTEHTETEPYIPKGYKQTEIGVIPEDWNSQPVDSVCKLINGRGFKPHEWGETGLPIIRIQNLNGSSNFNHFSGTYDPKLQVNAGQLLFAWSGSRGTSFGPHVWQGPQGLLNYHTWKVRIDKKQIDSEYFFHALKMLTAYIEDKAHGASALVHTQKWEMEKFEFPVPPTKTEQEAIAGALSDVDALISSLETLITKKRHIKQGAMQELLRPKEGWVEKGIGDLFCISAGGDLRKEEFSNEKDDLHPFPIYANSIAKSGYYGYCSTSDYSSNCITITARGGIGHAVARNCEFAAIGRLLILEPFGDTSCLFVAEYINLWIDFANESTGVPQLTAPQASKYVVHLPIPLEQHRIATILSYMDAEITALEAKLSKTRQLKQGMMAELLTGRIRLV